jgi:hypothetical protein
MVIIKANEAATCQQWFGGRAAPVEGVKESLCDGGAS